MKSPTSAGAAPSPRPASDLPASDAEWHASEADAALEGLKTGREGLSESEAARRLAEHGPNRLPQTARRSVLMRFLLQFKNLLIYVLLGAAAMAAAIGHGLDALVILGVVFVNAAIGFIQEGRAEKALEAIRGMIDPHASVMRDGRRSTIGADAVVPGDIVLIEAGDRVPADLRLIKVSGLTIDEAILTGESVPSEKALAPVELRAPLGDRTSMAFSGSFVTAGQGLGVAVSTGAGTELGRISTMLSSVQRLTTPLIRQMDQFARQVTFAVLAVSGLVFGFAFFVRGYALDDAFMAVVGLAVAAIPEGLPAVMTIALAVGVQRMARRNAIIRQLPAVETLGSVSVICSDKTGTLTRNEMAVRAIETGSGHFEVDAAGYAPEGEIRGERGPCAPEDDEILAESLLAALLCNDAHLRQAEGRWLVDGDPMEGALVSLAMKAGLDPVDLRRRHGRLDEIPFDARHRYMATLNTHEGGDPVIYLKGAPEQVVEMCAEIATPGGAGPLDRDHWRNRIETLAAQGQRVIGLARRTAAAGTSTITAGDVEEGLVFLGLVGLIDPPRPEAIAAVAECRAAGMRVKMITGDHAATARAIAQQLGIEEDPQAVTGSDLDGLSPEAFDKLAQTASVFARTTPEHKLRLVEALQKGGAVIAMTGDGVNDAPALKRADVGVAMGQKGSEAAKEAAEMVLADDNFASIVAAVREGRTVYDNLKKTILFLLPVNGGESLSIILALLFTPVLPITPIQILWVNMVSSVALALTLAFEPTEPNVMRRPPRPAGQAILDRFLLWRIGFVSLLFVTGVFGMFEWSMARGASVESARTLAVNTLVVMEVFYLFSVRYAHGTSLTWRGVLGTPAVLGGIAAVVVAQLVFTYTPFMQTVFGTRPVSVEEGAVVIAVGVVLLLVLESEKRIARWLGFERSPRGAVPA